MRGGAVRHTRLLLDRGRPLLPLLLLATLLLLAALLLLGTILLLPALLLLGTVLLCGGGRLCRTGVAGLPGGVSGRPLDRQHRRIALRSGALL